MDIKITRDYASWIVEAKTLRGRAVLQALSFADGAKLDNAAHLYLLDHAQRAGVEVGA